MPDPDPAQGESDVNRFTGESFEQWSKVADEYARHFRRLTNGDVSVWGEIRRLSQQLQSMNRTMRGKRSAVPIPDTMQTGIYEVQFSTAEGLVGTAAALIRNQSFVGADAAHFFRGRIERLGPDTTVQMDITRHNFEVQSAFGDETAFSVDWKGTVSGDNRFTLVSQGPDAKGPVHLVGRLIQGPPFAH